MPQDFKLLAGITGGLIILILVLTFTIFRTPTNQPQTTIITDDVDTVSELGAVVVGNETQLTIESFGGAENVKTLTENNAEYALIRNPEITGDLELIIIEPFGNYYFAETNNERVVFEQGSNLAKYGYNEIADISQRLLRNHNTDTEYFIAYPDSLSADIAGIAAVPDSGAANNFLETQRAVITNTNNNVTVIADIIHRGETQGVLPVSERTRKALGLDNGARGNLQIGFIAKSVTKPGVILPTRR